MSTEILVAVLSLAGTLAGSFAGILVANKLVNYRLLELERKVEKLAARPSAQRLPSRKSGLYQRICGK